MPLKRDPSWYGCRRDTKDARDEKWAFRPRVTRLPRMVDLFPSFPPVMNQGPLGCCTGHGTTTAIRYRMIADGHPDVPLSRLQNYYDARAIENSVAEDAGAEIRDNIKAAAEFGVAREDFWPYDPARFAEKPPQSAYEDALLFQALEYRRVSVSTACVKAALAEGHPVIIGISLYDSFEGDEVSRTGVVPMPDLEKEELLGGHCMIIGGYGQMAGHFTTRNSWDDDWGADGNCYIPYQMVGSKSFGSDYWIIPKVEFGHK